MSEKRNIEADLIRRFQRYLKKTPNNLDVDKNLKKIQVRTGDALIDTILMHTLCMNRPEDVIRLKATIDSSQLKLKILQQKESQERKPLMQLKMMMTMIFA